MSVYIREISRELGRAGHHVDIYTCAGSGRVDCGELLSENVRLIQLRIGNNGHIGKNALYEYLPEVFLSIEAHMNANNICYDLVHSHYWLSGSVGHLAQDRWCVPHIMMFHTTGIAKRMACGQEREPFLRLISEKRLAGASDRVLAATGNEKSLLMKYYDVPEENIGVVPCGVSLQRFHPVARELARRELGLHDSQFIALYVGRFAPVKGLERLLAAAAHLRFQRGLRFAIIGGDDQNTPASTELRRLAQRASLGGIVQFLGRIEHNLLPLYYSAADVLVVPSYYESFGLVALESLACGTPVIATRVGAMDTLIQDGKTGFLVDSPSPLLLASAIRDMMVAQSASRISRDQIRASVLGYGWSDVASAIVREYAIVLQPVAHIKTITRA
jgi:D-inositol-3-phosphate glycosyltransferase